MLCAQAVAGPFLVVVPLSTVPNWIREFRRWLPQCNALVYVGDSTSRKVSLTTAADCSCFYRQAAATRHSPSACSVLDCAFWHVYIYGPETWPPCFASQPSCPIITYSACVRNNLEQLADVSPKRYSKCAAWVQVARQFEFYNTHNTGRPFKFDVLITTYELVLKDAAELGKIKWSYLMVDEAHRLKNNESALYMVVPGFSYQEAYLSETAD